MAARSPTVKTFVQKLGTEDLTGWRAGHQWIQSAPLDRMAGCRDEYIDLMAGVSQIADGFAASY